jgi:hypothetical protein
MAWSHADWTMYGVMIPKPAEPPAEPCHAYGAGTGRQTHQQRHCHAIRAGRPAVAPEPSRMASLSLAAAARGRVRRSIYSCGIIYSCCLTPFGPAGRGSRAVPHMVRLYRDSPRQAHAQLHAALTGRPSFEGTVRTKRCGGAVAFCSSQRSIRGMPKAVEGLRMDACGLIFDVRGMPHGGP